MGGFTTYKHFDQAKNPPKSSVDGAQKSGADDGTGGCCGATESKKKSNSSHAEELDVRGLQCPGPLARLAQKASSSAKGTLLRVIASDIGFATDVKAFCSHGGHELVSVEKHKASIVAEICLHALAGPAQAKSNQPQKTMVVFSGDLDRVLAAFVLANAAADMGDKVTLFFTFWGLNALREPEKVSVKKGLIDRMFGAMMPRGAGRLKLSKMHMAGMGTAMMKKVMHDKNVESLPVMMANAQHKGVKIIACSMSMDVMGLSLEELIPGVEVGGAASFLAEASSSNTTLFI